MRTLLSKLAYLSLVLLTEPALATAAELKVGDKAPAFEAKADDGSIWRSSDHVGKQILVVYFYPAAMTPGCTKQACSFRDNQSKLQEFGAQVVGVSGDQEEGLRVFKGSNRLNFPLLSDPHGDVAKKFGVPVSQGGTITREVDGKEVELKREVTTARWTFIIGKDGRIAYKDTQVEPAGDGEAVLKALRKVQAGE